MVSQAHMLRNQSQIPRRLLVLFGARVLALPLTIRSMAELRQRKVAEPQGGAPINADARSPKLKALIRPPRQDKESGLLLFATPLIIILHIVLVSAPPNVMYVL